MPASAGRPAARRATDDHLPDDDTRRYADVVNPEPDSRRPRGPGRHRYGGRFRLDRPGRGLRGRLVPASVPLARTRAEIFDDLVLDTVESLEQRYSRELSGVEFAVEEVPPELNVYDTDVLED